MTAAWLNGCHQALNIATASRLRISGAASAKLRIFSPSSQSRLRRRRVESSGDAGTRTSVDAARRAVERHVLRLALVIELLAHPLADLDWRSRACRWRVEAAMEGEGELELAQIRLHGRLHVRILQLAGERRAVRGGRAMDLAERGGGGGLQVEGAEAAPPVGPELGLHPALHEGCPMGGASLCSFWSSAAYSGGIRSGMVARSCATFMIGPLRPPSACGERRRVRGVLPVAAEQASAGHAGRHAAHIGSDAGVAAPRGRKAVRFAIGFGHRSKAPQDLSCPSRLSSPEHHARGDRGARRSATRRKSAGANRLSAKTSLRANSLAPERVRFEGGRDGRPYPCSQPSRWRRPPGMGHPDGPERG